MRSNSGVRTVDAKDAAETGKHTAPESKSENKVKREKIIKQTTGSKK